jgi:hypothetical protein
VILLYNPLPLKYNKEIASFRLQYQKSNIKSQNDKLKCKNLAHFEVVYLSLRRALAVARRSRSKLAVKGVVVMEGRFFF